MTRSTLSPARRFTAALALAGVAGLGGVAVAPAALAEEPVVSASVTAAEPLVTVLPEITAVKGIGALPALIHRNNIKDVLVESPTPDSAVTFVLGRSRLTLPAEQAEDAQTALATVYTAAGHAVTFTSRGMLVIGPRTCDPAKSPAWNEGCVTGEGETPGGGRF